ncbi:MAG: carbohydrate-binding domain-containing protein [Lachnospiraceae bacterium]|nr:carbohydrate-binding domain-containing protein [Lachnospiraceae bacterium]
MKLQAFKKVAVFLCAVSFLLPGCGQQEVAAKPKVDEVVNYEEIYTITETDSDVSKETAKELLPEEGILINEQSLWEIKEGGAYLLKGSYDGQVQINAEDEKVHLILENVEINSPNGPAIYVKSAAKVILTVPEDSSSILKDSPYYDRYPDAKACVHSNSDLTINGSGSLQVYGYYKDAVRTKDVLKVLDTGLMVQAKGDGLRGNDGVAFQGRSLDIQCEGTGIYTEKEDKENKGFVDMAAGNIQIIAGEYGINASENIYLHACEADIYGILENLTCKGQQLVEEGCLK